MAKTIEALLRLKAENQTLKAFNQVSGSLDKINKKARQVSRAQEAAAQASRFDRVAASTHRAETAMLGYGRVVGALATGAAAKEIVTQAADFESRLTGIQKKAGLTSEQMAGLGNEIKTLATSGSLAVSIEDIMGAYERGAAAGLPIDQLKDFATLSAKAADAFEMSSEDVGNAAAGFKTAFKIDTAEVSKLFDLINSLADSGISDEKDIVDFIDRSGASLKLFGQSQQQVAALGATLLNLKMPAEVASRAMNTLSGKLLAPGSDKAEQSLRNIVKDTTKFQKLLKDDPNEALMLFLDKVGEMDKFNAVENLNGLLGAGFSDEVLRLAKGADEYHRNLKLAGNEAEWFGSLDKSYSLKLDDFWSQWQLMKNTISTTAIDIGDMGMPALKATMEGVKYTVGEINKGLKAFKGDLDWEEIDKAQEAVSDLGSKITELLGMNTGDSAIFVFFHDLAGAVNDVAAGVNKVENSDLFKVMSGNKQAAADVIGATVNPETGRLNKGAMDGGLFPGLTKFLAGATDSPDQMPGRIVYPPIRYNPVVPTFAQPEGDLGHKTEAIPTPHWRPEPDAPSRAPEDGASALRSELTGPVPVIVDNVDALMPTTLVEPRAAPVATPLARTPVTAPVIGAREAEAASLHALRALRGSDPEVFSQSQEKPRAAKVALLPPQQVVTPAPLPDTMVLRVQEPAPLPTLKSSDRPADFGTGAYSDTPVATVQPFPEPVTAGMPSPMPVLVDNIAELMPAPSPIAPNWGLTAPVVSAREADMASMAAMRQQYGGLLNSEGQSFQPGTTGQDVTDEVDPDALRQAMEAGAQSIAQSGETVAQGGRDAQAAIDQSGAQLPTQGQQAGQALAAAAGAGLTSHAAAAGAAMAQAFNANVKVPAAPRMPAALPAANRAPATTMPDAGKAGG
ncbi:hypothetical protein Sa4125_25090 [Aureimonas sp. SA4125]|uniref:phage tail tape measure protein n=1 Tax=Aureimonas sp. SA4125 TaxID=2826993 RepID=UPI001CC3CB7F|nr:phage tail tape measure protein [Aureimonas sp. SA4125]BDA84967.1 hypothetical protein Sa4125_25090 [Aureimonas sp. SA4125]